MQFLYKIANKLGLHPETYLNSNPCLGDWSTDYFFVFGVLIALTYLYFSYNCFRMIKKMNELIGGYWFIIALMCVFVLCGILHVTNTYAYINSDFRLLAIILYPLLFGAMIMLLLISRKVRKNLNDLVPTSNTRELLSKIEDLEKQIQIEKINYNNLEIDVLKAIKDENYKKLRKILK